jgi:hypothetical protein
MGEHPPVTAEMLLRALGDSERTSQADSHRVLFMRVLFSVLRTI